MTKWVANIVIGTTTGIFVYAMILWLGVGHTDVAIYKAAVVTLLATCYARNWSQPTEKKGGEEFFYATNARDGR